MVLQSISVYNQRVCYLPIFKNRPFYKCLYISGLLKIEKLVNIFNVLFISDLYCMILREQRLLIRIAILIYRKKCRNKNFSSEQICGYSRSYPGLSTELTLPLENYNQKTHRKALKSRFCLRYPVLVKVLGESGRRACVFKGSLVL